MGSPLNATLPGVGSAISVVSTTEIVAVVSNPVNLDAVVTQVQLEWAVDLTNSSSGTTVTVKVRRGNGITGTLVTGANTWGPFTLTSSNRSNFSGVAYDVPGAEGGAVYSVTVTIAGNSGSPTINTATVQATASSQS
jgi:hypothetical protein